MPILKPQIAAALREAGLTKDEAELGLVAEMDSQGLSLESTIRTLREVQENSDSPNIRLQAVKLSLQARGLLQETQAPLPSITFIINDPHAPAGINPILVPRELRRPDFSAEKPN